MEQPLVSVIIPTHGRTDFVKDAIESVQNQTYKNIEIIVVDDNALLPDVRSEIKRIASEIPNCTLIQNKMNLGGALTRNEGIKASKGELISFLDDDDTYLPTRIEKVVGLYLNHKEEKVGIIYTYCYSCDENLNVQGEYCNVPTENPLYRHMLGCLCATSQWTIPKEVFDKVGMFEETPCKQDSIMLMKILGNNYTAICVKECLSKYRVHGKGQISGNYETHIIGETNLLNWQRKYYDQLSPPQVAHAESCTKRQIMLNYAGANMRKEAFNLYFDILRTDKSCLNKFEDFITILFTSNIIMSLRLRLEKLKHLIIQD